MQTYVIRRSFLAPLGLLLLLAAALFVVCIEQGQPRAKLLILGAILLPVVILFVECAWRKVQIDAEQLIAVRLLRRKTLRFAEVTAVETVTLRNRTFFTLCAGDEFVILSNSYADFPGLVRTVLERVPPQAVSAETLAMAERPPVKLSDIVSSWVAAGVLAAILLLQLRSGG